MKLAIVTGSNGLIGSQAVSFLINKNYTVYGIDNDMRSYFFGKESSTKNSGESLKKEYGDNYIIIDEDIRNTEKINNIFKEISLNGDLDLVIHTAAQPSHDWASNEPLTDFTINSLGTMNLLESSRIYCPKATFIFTSTNKVYGDRPNLSFETGNPDPEYMGLTIEEESTRYEGRFLDRSLASIDETLSIDQCKHSIFGASKVSADVMVQEYGNYFGMNTVVFRGGCLTGPNHAGAELHGFLSYLIKCVVNDKPYSIFGYKGKQVRDNIHSWDLINMFWHYHQSPKPGKVYNAGGGRDNSISILEAIDIINTLLYEYNENHTIWKKYAIKNDNRSGDHIWYITDFTKFKNDYPEWPGITISVKDIIKQIVNKEVSNPDKSQKLKDMRVITFAKGNFINSQNKLIEHLYNIGINNVLGLTDNDLSNEFKNTYSKILSHRKGYGYCIWKPYIILNELEKIKDGEILIYIDSTDHPHTDFFDFVNEHMTKNDILLINRGYTHDNWTRRDTFILMECDEDKYHNKLQLEAGIIAIKKTNFNIELINEWFNYCKNENILADIPQISNLPNYQPFYEHRYDQSILTNLQIKYGIPHFRLADHMILFNANQPISY